MILASQFVDINFTLFIFRYGKQCVLAGVSQGPCLGRVLDQMVWLVLPQGSDVILAIQFVDIIFTLFIFRLTMVNECRASV